MKFKLPKPDTMDKAVLVVAVLGVIVAFLTIRHTPTPEEVLAKVNGTLDDLITLQTMSNHAIDLGDYTSACEFQKRSTDLVLQNNLFDLGIDVDNLYKLEKLVCDQANKNLI